MVLSTGLCRRGGRIYGGDSNPAWEEKSRVLEPSSKGEDARGDVGVAGVYCE